MFLLPGSVAAPRATAPNSEFLRAVPDEQAGLAEPDDEGMPFAVRAAVVAERARIARDLHDALSKSLLGVAMAASAIASPQRTLDPQQADQLSELARSARQAVAKAWYAINDLRDDALGDAVRSVAAAWGIASGIRVSLAVAAGSEATEEVSREIVRILRDALHNVERHAHATRVRVSLRRGPDQLRLTVADNGSGFSLPADLREQSASRYGLISIAERARRVGGILIIRSRPGRGTRITAEIPVPAAARPHLRAVPSDPAVRVVVADEDPVLRAGLRQMLEQAPDIEIVDEAGTGEEAVEQVRRHRPDVLLFDARMPLRNGLPAIGEISPLTQIVVVTRVENASLVVRSISVGVRGYVVPGEFEASELAQVVLDAARRRSLLPPHAAAEVAARFQSEIGYTGLRPAGELTPRERQVMGLIADGLSNRQIAARLVISEKTVKNHICSIYQRFGVYERSQAVIRWRNSDGLLAHPARPAS